MRTKIFILLVLKQTHVNSQEDASNSYYYKIREQ